MLYALLYPYNISSYTVLRFIWKQVTLEDFHYITRMHYKSRNADGDARWGEHEIDYILFIQKDVPLEVNPNEVKAVKYVTPSELIQHISK